MSISVRHARTLTAIFATPTLPNIRFADIEALVVALGGTVREGDGFRVRLSLNGYRATLHRPPPRGDTSRDTVRCVRDWLRAARVEADR